MERLGTNAAIFSDGDLGLDTMYAKSAARNMVLEPAPPAVQSDAYEAGHEAAAHPRPHHDERKRRSILYPCHGCWHAKANPLRIVNTKRCDRREWKLLPGHFPPPPPALEAALMPVVHSAIPPRLDYSDPRIRKSFGPPASAH